MIDEVPTDPRAADVQERQMHVRPPLVADAQAAVAVEPRDRPPDYPPVPPEPLAALYPAARDARRNPSPAQLLARRPRVISLIGVQLRGRSRGLPLGRLIGSIASMVSSIMRESWTLPALIVTASGTPCRSTTTWRFVPGSPRSVGLGPASRPPFAPAPPMSRARRATSRCGRLRPGG
jgi:hypothetical protein